MTSYQENTEPNSLLSVECWQPIAQQHIGITINRNGFLKHKRVK